MRLSCDVSVSIRAGGARPAARAVRSSLALGAKDGDAVLILSTVADRAGRKYKDINKGNLEKAFTKFAGEGKATLRLSMPPHDLCLSKADPIQLKAFLGVLRSAVEGKPIKEVNLSALQPPSLEQVSKPKARLVIARKKDYPITTSFPHTLEALVAAGLNLKRVDGRMIKLRHLRILDLSDNALGPGVADGLGEMRNLKQLYLSGNKISLPPSFSFCRSKLSSTLTLLDLGGNQLKELPNHICHLTSLVSLIVKNNALKRLPLSMDKMTSLRFLNADGNQLETLPGGLLKLGLEKLDVSGNPFRDCKDSGSVLFSRLGFPSLLDLCLAFCVKKRVNLDEGSVPGTVLHQRDARSHCRCGKICFSSRAVVLNAVPLLSMSSEVSADHNNVLLEAVVCSKACLKRYATNMFAV